ncbi:hypothetical protein S245_020542, partial [Arachis hypogaea]
QRQNEQRKRAMKTHSRDGLQWGGGQIETSPPEQDLREEEADNEKRTSGAEANRAFTVEKKLSCRCQRWLLR